MASDSPQPPLSPPPPDPVPPPSPGTSGGANPLANRNLLIGIAIAAVVLLLLSCCCCGGCTLFRGGLGSNSRLVGTWKGKDALGFGIDFELQLKANGRYEYTYKGPFVGASTSTGDWRVKLVEGERYILDTVNDGSPDETIGWTVTFEEPDQILLNQPNGDSWRLKRQ